MTSPAVLFATLRHDLRADSVLDRSLLLVMAGMVLLLPFVLWFHSLADIAISTTAILYLVVGARSGHLARMGRQPWFILGLVLWAYLTARGLASDHVEKSAGTAVVWVRYIVFAAALCLLLERSAALGRLMLAGFVVAAGLVAADTLFQAVTGTDVFGRPIYFGVDDHGQPIPTTFRLTGPLDRPVVGVALLYIGLPAFTALLLLAARPATGLPLRAAAILGAMVYAITIILSGERMALLLLGLALVILLFAVLRPRPLVVGGLGLGAVVVAAALAMLAPHIVARHLSVLQELAMGGQSIYLRLPLAAWEVFANNPLFGTGVRTFRYECYTHATTPEMATVCSNLHPHHLWMEILSDTGLVGLVLFVALFIVALRPAVVQWRTWAGDALLAGAAISVLVRLWPLATSGSFFTNRGEVVFWTMMALCIGLAGRRDARRDTSN